MPARPRTPASTAPSELVQGLRAGLAVFARRPDDVVRVLHTRSIRHELLELVRWAASRRIPCVEAPAAELDRLAESMHHEGGHHEGLLLVTQPRRWASARELADALARAPHGSAVAIDRVRNPYNVGAVLRSAAFFGFRGALFGPQAHPAAQAAQAQNSQLLSATAVRVAEGGVEQLLLARTTDLADTLARLRERGVRVVGADGHATTSAVGFAYGSPVILVLGNEREGLGDRARAQCDALVSIPGSGTVESLNVAVAAGVLMAEVTRSTRV